MARVLLVDDEAPLRESLTYALTREGYSVVTAADGAAALQIFAAERLDVIVLDLMLPVVDGMEVCRRVRSTSDVPIVMLTAKDQPADTVDGLETGADDYVTKPFNTRELIARIASAVRRHEATRRLLLDDRELVARMSELVDQASQPHPVVTTPAGGTAEVVAAGPLVLDTGARSVVLDGKRLALSHTEFDVLRVLVVHANRVVTRTELIEQIWGSPTRERLIMLDAHIRCIREKIEKDPARPKLLHTVPGIGFELLER